MRQSERATGLKTLVSMDDVLELRETDGAKTRKITLSGGTGFIVGGNNRNGLFNIPALDFHIFQFQIRGRAEITIQTDQMIGPETAIAHPGRFGFWPAGKSWKSTVIAKRPTENIQLLIPRGQIRHTLKQQLGYECDDVTGMLARRGFAPDKLLRLSNLLNDEFENGGKASSSLLAALAEALSIELLRHCCAELVPAAEKRAKLSHSDSRLILDLLQDAVVGTYSLADIAEIIGMEPYQLTRVFRSSFGETPREYLLRLRLERAQRLLENSELCLSAIAIDCGFSSQAHMTCVFSKKLGTTPARYRAENRSNKDATP